MKSYKKQFLTEAEVLDLIENPIPGERFAGIYSKLIKIIYYTAGRPREIINLKRKDIDLNKNVMTLGGTAKSPHRYRTIPIATVILDDLKQLLKADGTTYLFSFKKRGIEKQASMTTLTHRMRERATALGIKKKIYPYGLRHAGIARMVEALVMSPTDITTLTDIKVYYES